MNRAPDENPLLAEVLGDAAPGDFRAALRGETRRLAQRRRVVRRAQHAGAVAVAACAIAFVYWNLPALPPPAPAYVLTRSEPLEAASRVTTQPFAVSQIVTTTPTVAVIRTAPKTGIVRLIDDEELLALASPRPAALVRVGPGEQELVFADNDTPADSR